VPLAIDLLYTMEVVQIQTCVAQNASSRRIIQHLLEQTYENITSLITNIIVIEALLAGLTMSILLTIPADEFINGDIVAMAHNSRNFRCRFAPDSKYDLCYGKANYSVSFCEARGAATRIACDYQDTARMLLVGKCEVANLVESRKIASSVDKERFLEYLAETLYAGRTNVSAPLYLGGTPAASNVFSGDLIKETNVCLPSMNVAFYGYSCVFHTMVTLFVSLFLFLSINLSKCREDCIERFYWWCPVGMAFILFTFAELMNSTYNFILYAEYVIAIRFPYLQHGSLWKRTMLYDAVWPGSSQDSFWFVTFYICAPLIGGHFLLLRGFRTLVPPTWCDPRRTFDDVKFDKCKQFLESSGLDIEILRSIHNDMLLREELICAGMTSPQDRLLMIAFIRLSLKSPSLSETPTFLCAQ
jgi:hypothetical protein